MSEKQYILKRTTTEEYEYDPARLALLFADEYEKFRADNVATRIRLNHPQATEDQLWEMFVVELFEKHDGSIFGDDLFGQIDCDYGIETLTRSEDD